MRIAIRADGGSQIGMGHIMRSLVLAKELSKYHEVFFICRVDNPLTDKYEAGINKIKKEGFRIVYINENEVIDGLKKVTADVLFTDSYDVDQEYFNNTKEMFEITGYMDDMNLYKFNVDFIVNHNIDALEQRYDVPKNCKLFLGTRYLLLRNEFKKKLINDYNKTLKNIMITVGGGDPFNVTYKLLQMINKENYTYHVIIGNAFGNIDELRELSTQNSNINLYFNADMAEIMKKCDIAISACGSTLYELSLCGVPTIGIIVGKDQVSIANKMNSEGLILSLGWYHNLEKDTIIKSINYMNDYNNRLRIVKKQEKINTNSVTKLCTELNSFFTRGET